jgi:hypothetical protein
MASMATLAPDAAELLFEVERRFDLDDRERVLDYLDRHPHLLPLLIDVADQIPRYFRPDDRAFLQVIQDAETDVAQFYAIVRSSLGPDETESCLDRLDEEWWLDAVERAGGDLTVDAKAR